MALDNAKMPSLKDKIREESERVLAELPALEVEPLESVKKSKKTLEKVGKGGKKLNK